MSKFPALASVFHPAVAFAIVAVFCAPLVVIFLLPLILVALGLHLKSATFTTKNDPPPDCRDGPVALPDAPFGQIHLAFGSP